MVNLTILIFVLIVFLAREVVFFIERMEWTKERQTLLDRIQAGTLVEYKTLNMKPKPPKERKKGVDFI